MDAADDVLEQLLTRIRFCKKFSLQLDESTDVAGEAQLMTYVRYLTEENIEEDLLFCRPLPTRTTSDEIFKMLNNFMVVNEISWEWCYGVCTDGAAAMTGRSTGVWEQIRPVAPNAIFTHCMLHRESLASKKMSSELRSTFDKAVKIVNFIKSRPLNSRIFAQLCAEMGSEHTQLLLHTEVRWLSRGNVLSRLFDL